LNRCAGRCINSSHRTASGRQRGVETAAQRQQVSKSKTSPRAG
jgi:hypothetical protein